MSRWVIFFGNLEQKQCIYFLLHRIKLIGGEVVLLPPSASSHACKQTGSLRDESPSTSDVTMVQWRHQPCCSHGNRPEASECRRLHINTHPRTGVTTCVEILRLVVIHIDKSAEINFWFIYSWTAMERTVNIKRWPDDTHWIHILSFQYWGQFFHF